MPADPHAEVEALIDRLHERRLRVWSIVITFFGDAVVPRGGQVWLSVVGALMERLRVNPGTLGAAMSRLTAERWLVRERVGRRTRYRLDDAGKLAFEEAARRVYGLDDADWADSWTIRVAEPGSDPERWRASGFGALGPDLYLRPERIHPLPAPEAIALPIRPDPAASSTLAARAFPLDESEARHVRLREAMTPLRTALEAGAPLDPVDAIAARTLLVHAYRRVILREVPLPASALPAGSARRTNRTWVGELYRALVPASEAWLDQPVGAPEDAGLPRCDPGFRRRFGGL